MKGAYTIGSLFAGIGGFDYAFEAAGFTTAWQVERDPFCLKVLAKHFPDATRHTDIYDCHALPYVDVITAGFPCQPFSVAGSRKGADDERYLIPEMLRVIDEVKPRVLLLENVPGFTSLNDGAEFRKLLQALAEMGFDAEWGCVSAADAGAPHRRERWLCVSYAREQRRQEPPARNAALNQQWQHSPQERNGRNVLHAPVAGGQTVEYTAGSRRGAGFNHRQRRHVLLDELRRSSQEKRQRYGWLNRAGAFGEAVGNSDGGSYKTQWSGRQQRALARHFAGQSQGADYRGHGDGDQSGVGTAVDGFSRRLVGHRWPAGQGSEQYEFEPPRVLAATTPHWQDKVRAIGNAVVPQCVYPVALSIREFLQSVDAGAEGIAA